MTNHKLEFAHGSALGVRCGGNWDRREFVKGVAALAGSAALLGYDLSPAVAEPPPEVTKIRLVQDPGICLAPQFMAEDLLRLEGFSQIEYAPWRAEDSDNFVLLADGRADITMDGATALVPALDAGRPLVVLAGVHGGCYELFGNERVRAIRDLRGKKSLLACSEAQTTSTSPA